MIDSSYSRELGMLREAQLYKDPITNQLIEH